jgi:hypothetical protein
MSAQRPHRIVNLSEGQEVTVTCHTYASDVATGPAFSFNWGNSAQNVVEIQPTGMSLESCKLKGLAPGIAYVSCRVALNAAGAQAPFYVDDLTDMIMVAVGRVVADTASIDNA